MSKKRLESESNKHHWLGDVSRTTKLADKMFLASSRNINLTSNWDKLRDSSDNDARCWWRGIKKEVIMTEAIKHNAMIYFFALYANQLQFFGVVNGKWKSKIGWINRKDSSDYFLNVNHTFLLKNSLRFCQEKGEIKHFCCCQFVFRCNRMILPHDEINLVFANRLFYASVEVEMSCTFDR